jgi:hypothetical protein
MARHNLGKKINANGTLDDLGNTVSDDDLNKIDGALLYLTQTLTTSQKTQARNNIDATNVDFVNQRVETVAKTVPLDIETTKPQIYSYWESVTFNGVSNLNAENIWSDGENTYYSNGTSHYKLQKDTRTWESITWNGLTNFYGQYVWAYGNYIYYSQASSQYSLNKDTNTWEKHTWGGGFNSFYAYSLWTDGKIIYHSNGSSQKQLPWNNINWQSKTWTGLTSFAGSNIWTDGNYIYYSSGTTHYYIDPYNNTWMPKTWYGLTNVSSFSGANIWTDGKNIYYSNGGSNQYILQRGTNTWKVFDQKNGAANIYRSGIWTDGSNIYYSYANKNYVLMDATTPKTTVTVKTVKSVNGKTGHITGLATEEYVNQNGSKIDSISVNGVTQPIVNKNVNIEMLETEDYSQSSEVNNALTNYVTKNELLNLTHPINSIYISINSTSPSQLFGGTWVELPAGTALWTTATASGDAGGTIAAGLPNITGTWTTSWNQPNRGFHSLTTSGAFYDSYSAGLHDGAGRIQGTDDNNSGTRGFPWFDASRSNSIYGNSNTVQPPAYKIYAWRRTA